MPSDVDLQRARRSCPGLHRRRRRRRSDRWRSGGAPLAASRDRRAVEQVDRAPRTRRSPSGAPAGADSTSRRLTRSASSRCSTRWLPAKPVAPVTRDRTPATAVSRVRRTAPDSTARNAGSSSLIGRHHHSFVAVPRDRLGEPRVEGDLRGPAERCELGGVERVAAVVARPIGDAADQRRRACPTSARIRCVRSAFVTWLPPPTL